MEVPKRSPRNLFNRIKATPTNASELNSAQKQKKQLSQSLQASKERNFTLTEHSDTIMEIWIRHVKAFYKRDDEIFVDELPIKNIMQYFVKSGIALDRDKARQAVEQEIGSPL